MGRPTSIRIFLVNGAPDGIRIVEKSNWTGRAVVASRAQLTEALRRDELSRPGVYVLTGPDDDGAPSLYVGEADVLGDRLRNHASRKDFWTRFVAFTSTDESLNKALVRHLESRLVALAKAANQWELENTAIPGEPPMSEADRADADWFLQEMLVIYPILGIDAFEAASAEAPAPDAAGDLVLSQRGSSSLLAHGPEGRRPRRLKHRYARHASDSSNAGSCGTKASTWCSHRTSGSAPHLRRHQCSAAATPTAAKHGARGAVGCSRTYKLHAPRRTDAGSSSA